MNAQTALEELETLAGKLEVDVAHERLLGEGNTGGGLCRIKGKWRVIIERRASASEKVSLLARCLARFDMDSHFVSPAVRKLIERHRPATPPEESLDAAEEVVGSDPSIGGGTPDVGEPARDTGDAGQDVVAPGPDVAGDGQSVGSEAV